VPPAYICCCRLRIGQNKHFRVLAFVDPIRATKRSGRSRLRSQSGLVSFQGRTQRAPAGPGLFEQDALSISPFLLIETAQHPRRLRLLRWRPVAFDVVDRGLAEPARAAEQDSPWHEYRGRGPITKNQVAALLRDYDIRPVVLHPTKRADFSRHGYRAAHFEDALARFLPHEPNIRTLKRGRDGM
jgi:hypothetical protein